MNMSEATNSPSFFFADERIRLVTMPSDGICLAEHVVIFGTLCTANDVHDAALWGPGLSICDCCSKRGGVLALRTNLRVCLGILYDGIRVGVMDTEEDISDWQLSRSLHVYR